VEYRPDIDGVRAIAVLSVILAHAEVPFVSGGFLGVDVFFVISGYLITSILMREIGEGRYSVLKFYERRARRILPALVLVIACCVPFAAWLMLPEFLENFGQSIVATLLFSNNILLALTAGYWDLASSFKPLLHTWSLGVEEQFYLAFPLILARVWRYGRKAQLGTIIALGLVSFAVSEIGWRTHPAASFYLPTSRAWELMAGCAIAYVSRCPRRFDHLCASLGLAAILGSMVIFSPATPSPSIFSAVPVFGTMAVILFSRPGSLACWVLSWPPLVGIGLVSYSAYLWHQPLFALARIVSLKPPPLVEMAALAMVTLGLAYLSWRFVECPFRRQTFPLRRSCLLSCCPPPRSSPWALPRTWKAAFTAGGSPTRREESTRPTLIASIAIRPTLSRTTAGRTFY
jgi:peptidoglycan/LPS O-acetylase OafA/YrhL